jgi:hypothetical protein
MARKLLVPIEKLKKSQTKATLMNFRVEEELVEAFKKFCADELKIPLSDALRKMMRELCVRHGYLKK